MKKLGTTCQRTPAPLLIQWYFWVQSMVLHIQRIHQLTPAKLLQKENSLYSYKAWMVYIFLYKVFHLLNFFKMILVWIWLEIILYDKKNNTMKFHITEKQWHHTLKMFYQCNEQLNFEWICYSKTSNLSNYFKCKTIYITFFIIIWHIFIYHITEV